MKRKSADYLCQRCSQLPPPPPIFSIGPPPNILSVNLRCPSRILSITSNQNKKVTSSSPFVSVTLGIIIALLISIGTIVLIKNRMFKRRQRRQRTHDDSSSSIKFNGHNHQENCTNFIPLLSDSCSSDNTLSTPPSEYPCPMMEPFLSNDVHHEYEQIKFDNSSNYYCLVYCRQCSAYHQTTTSLYQQQNTIRSYYQYPCTCQVRNNNHLFELQPIIRRNHEDTSHQSSI